MNINKLMGYDALYQSIKQKQVPIKTAYKMSQLANSIQSKKEFYQSTFKSILETYGLKDEQGKFIFTEDGQSVCIIEGKQQECNDKIQELNNLDVSVDDITFTFEELEPLELTIEQVTTLAPFIKE